MNKLVKRKRSSYPSVFIGALVALCIAYVLYSYNPLLRTLSAIISFILVLSVIRRFVDLLNTKRINSHRGNIQVETSLGGVIVDSPIREVEFFGWDTEKPKKDSIFELQLTGRVFAFKNSAYNGLTELNTFLKEYVDSSTFTAEKQEKAQRQRAKRLLFQNFLWLLIFLVLIYSNAFHIKEWELVEKKVTFKELVNSIDSENIAMSFSTSESEMNYKIVGFTFQDELAGLSGEAISIQVLALPHYQWMFTKLTKIAGPKHFDQLKESLNVPVYGIRSHLRTMWSPAEYNKKQERLDGMFVFVYVAIFFLGGIIKPLFQIFSVRRILKSINENWNIGSRSYTF